jgi:hypothetical protein
VRLEVPQQRLIHPAVDASGAATPIAEPTAEAAPAVAEALRAAKAAGVPGGGESVPRAGLQTGWGARAERAPAASADSPRR